MATNECSNAPPPDNVPQPAFEDNVLTPVYDERTGQSLQVLKHPGNGQSVFPLAFFSTKASRLPPRCFPFDDPPQPFVISDRNHFILQTEASLRFMHRHFANGVFAPWDLRWFFDEYDIILFGEENLYNVMERMQQNNEELVREFVTNWAKHHPYQHEQVMRLGHRDLFHIDDMIKYGDKFLWHAQQYMIGAFHRAQIGMPIINFDGTITPLVPYPVQAGPPSQQPASHGSSSQDHGRRHPEESSTPGNSSDPSYTCSLPSSWTNNSRNNSQADSCPSYTCSLPTSFASHSQSNSQVEFKQTHATSGQPSWDLHAYGQGLDAPYPHCLQPMAPMMVPLMAMDVPVPAFHGWCNGLPVYSDVNPYSVTPYLVGPPAPPETIPHVQDGPPASKYAPAEDPSMVPAGNLFITQNQANACIGTIDENVITNNETESTQHHPNRASKKPFIPSQHGHGRGGVRAINDRNFGVTYEVRRATWPKIKVEKSTPVGQHPQGLPEHEAHELFLRHAPIDLNNVDWSDVRSRMTVGSHFIGRDVTDVTSLFFACIQGREPTLEQVRAAFGAYGIHVMKLHFVPCVHAIGKQKSYLTFENTDMARKALQLGQIHVDGHMIRVDVPYKHRTTDLPSWLNYGRPSSTPTSAHAIQQVERRPTHNKSGSNESTKTQIAHRRTSNQSQVSDGTTEQVNGHAEIIPASEASHPNISFQAAATTSSRDDEAATKPETELAVVAQPLEPLTSSVATLEQDLPCQNSILEDIPEEPDHEIEAIIDSYSDTPDVPELVDTQIIPAVDIQTIPAVEVANEESNEAPISDKVRTTKKELDAFSSTLSHKAKRRQKKAQAKAEPQLRRSQSPNSSNTTDSSGENAAIRAQKPKPKSKRSKAKTIKATTPAVPNDVNVEVNTTAPSIEAAPIVANTNIAPIEPAEVVQDTTPPTIPTVNNATMDVDVEVFEEIDLTDDTTVPIVCLPDDIKIDATIELAPVESSVVTEDTTVPATPISGDANIDTSFEVAPIEPVELVEHDQAPIVNLPNDESSDFAKRLASLQPITIAGMNPKPPPPDKIEYDACPFKLEAAYHKARKYRPSQPSLLCTEVFPWDIKSEPGDMYQSAPEYEYDGQLSPHTMPEYSALLHAHTMPQFDWSDEVSADEVFKDGKLINTNTKPLTPEECLIGTDGAELYHVSLLEEQAKQSQLIDDWLVEMCNNAPDHPTVEPPQDVAVTNDEPSMVEPEQQPIEAVQQVAITNDEVSAVDPVQQLTHNSQQVEITNAEVSKVELEQLPTDELQQPAIVIDETPRVEESQQIVPATDDTSKVEAVIQASELEPQPAHEPQQIVPAIDQTVDIELEPKEVAISSPASIKAEPEPKEVTISSPSTTTLSASFPSDDEETFKRKKVNAMDIISKMTKEDGTSALSSNGLVDWRPKFDAISSMIDQAPKDFNKASLNRQIESLKEDIVSKERTILNLGEKLASSSKSVIKKSRPKFRAAVEQYNELMEDVDMLVETARNATTIPPALVTPANVDDRADAGPTHKEFLDLSVQQTKDISPLSHKSKNVVEHSNESFTIARRTYYASNKKSYNHSYNTLMLNDGHENIVSGDSTVDTSKVVVPAVTTQNSAPTYGVGEQTILGPDWSSTSFANLGKEPEQQPIITQIDTTPSINLDKDNGPQTPVVKSSVLPISQAAPTVKVSYAEALRSQTQSPSTIPTSTNTKDTTPVVDKSNDVDKEVVHSDDEEDHSHYCCLHGHGCGKGKKASAKAPKKLVGKKVADPWAVGKEGEWGTSGMKGVSKKL